MNSSHRPLRVAWPGCRLGRLLILSLLLSVLPVFCPGQPAANAAAASSHAGQVPTESWLITWDASTSGSGSNGGRSVTRQTRVTASIVVNYYPDGSSEYYANKYTATYLFDALTVDSCPEGGNYRSHTRYELMDPSRYDGIGPVTPNGVMPYKPTLWTGTKLTTPGLNLILGGFTSDYHHEVTYCGGDGERYSDSDPDSLAFVENLTSDIRSPFNSDDDGVFRYDVDTQIQMYENGVSYPLSLKEHLRMELQTELDLTVRELEVTQGLQLHNAIPLVQGRRTIVRAYIDIGVDPGPIANVTARLRGFDTGILLGELEPFNMAGSITAKRSPNWRNLNDTLNFELPHDWTLLPDVRLDVEVNYTHQIGEKNYANNVHSVTLPLRNCSPITIGYLPIRYAPPGVTPTSPDADIARGQEFLRKVYPVADDELIYKPWPGITWDRPIQGATITDTYDYGTALVQGLVGTLFTSSGPRVDRLIGWLPDGVSRQLYGLADNIPGHVAWVEQTKNPDYWRNTFAHEVGHTYGLSHGPLTTGGYHWIDVYERTIKPPAVNGGLRDLMYPWAVPAKEVWISPQNYSALFNYTSLLGRLCPGSTGASQPSQRQTAEDLLVVSGRVSLTDTQSGELGPLYRTTGTSLIPPAGSTYFIVLKNGATELGKYGFDMKQEVDSSEPFTPTIGSFALTVPYPAGLNQVDLTDQYGHLLNSRTPSAHPPTVTVQFPNEAGLTLSGVHTIQWTGSDSDGDTLTYSVLYSADNGASWTGIGSGITGTSHEVDFDTIPGSDAALIKVLVTDGFHTASDVSDQPFAVPAKPPIPVIVSPPAGSHFKVGEQIKLQGYGVDLEEGMISSGSLSWSSDLDGALGSGGLREVTLSEGTHTVILALAGSTASATTTVVVEAAPSPPPKSYLYLPRVSR